MKIAVIGAGVIGLTSAYELALDGHKVSIFEQESAAATRASFANSGLISPSLTPYLSHPIWPPAGWWSRSRSLQHLRLGTNLAWNDLRWLRSWKRANRLDGTIQNAAVAHALIEAGKQRIHAITANEKLDLERTEGQLVLFNTETGLAQFREKLATLKSWGILANEIAPNEIQKIEPGFNPSASLIRAIHLPGDEVGNCRQFALGIRKALQTMGVEFNFNASISSIQSSPRPRIHFQGGATHLDFDHIVVCTGAQIPPLSYSTGNSVPMVSVASYSLTARIKEDINAPRSAIYTPHDCTSIVRMGKRVRVSFGAELGTRPNKNHIKAVGHMYHALQQAFPGGADYSNSVQIWKGNMAVTADGLPIIGSSSQPGVWFNLGHGPNGWGMACGAAMCLSAAIGNRPACIDMSKVSPFR